MPIQCATPRNSGRAARKMECVEIDELRIVVGQDRNAVTGDQPERRECRREPLDAAEIVGMGYPPFAEDECRPLRKDGSITPDDVDEP
jgi:hypothetical protein